MRFSAIQLRQACLLLSIPVAALAFIEHLRNKADFQPGVDEILKVMPSDANMHVRAETQYGLLALELDLHQDSLSKHIFWRDSSKPSHEITRILPSQLAGKVLELGPNDIGFAFWSFDKEGKRLLQTVGTIKNAGYAQPDESGGLGRRCKEEAVFAYSAVSSVRQELEDTFRCPTSLLRLRVTASVLREKGPLRRYG
ncbi:hypothetical protein BCV70DRAFT_207076 [Testicularia cyperi]|uniref:Uncharacterized protein n=1 Tax=Testicularia cyperi TaxID=1882483 RepID=A0A317XME8_9BASI|nr:hypothetical protein BCV70DRAFT_207076 [Testicularia cyperi]